MKTVVINLPYRKDRLNTFNENNSIEYELYQAVDGKSISYERLKEQGYDVNHNWTDPILGTTLTKGEVGCFLSHWQIWNNLPPRDFPSTIPCDRINPRRNVGWDNPLHTRQANRKRRNIAIQNARIHWNYLAFHYLSMHNSLHNNRTNRAQ